MEENTIIKNTKIFRNLINLENSNLYECEHIEIIFSRENKIFSEQVTEICQKLCLYQNLRTLKMDLWFHPNDQFNIRDLEALLCKLNNLTTFNLSLKWDEIIEEKIFSQLAKVVQNCQKLKNLALKVYPPYSGYPKPKFIQIGTEEFLQFAQSIGSCEDLNNLKLKIKSFQILDNNLQDLGENIANCQHLTFCHLDLSDCITNITDQCFDKMFKNCKKLSQMTFIFNNNKSYDQSVSNFAKQLSSCQNLNYLDIQFNNNYLEGTGLFDLAKILENFQEMQTFILLIKNNYLGNEGISEICKSLKQLQNLKTSQLDFSQNTSVNDSFLTEFGNCMQEYSNNLTNFHLDLSGNTIHTQGIVDFSIGLRNCKSLQNLSLKFFDNYMSDDGAFKLCQNLPYGIKNLTLELSGNKITKSGANQLAAALENQNMIEDFKLTISSNQILSEGLTCIGKSVAQMKLLKYLTLNLAWNSISYDGLINLGYELTNCKNLKYIHLNLLQNENIQEAFQILIQNLSQLKQLTNLTIFISYNQNQRQIFANKLMKKCKRLVAIKISSFPF
ncbi:hypothetical protein ABPG74_004777 [Tetrahymena malaccensis]